MQLSPIQVKGRKHLRYTVVVEVDEVAVDFARDWVAKRCYPFMESRVCESFFNFD